MLKFFLNKVASLNFVKKETLAQVFSCEVCEVSKNTFFTEHLRATASDISKLYCPLQLFVTVTPNHENNAKILPVYSEY